MPKHPEVIYQPTVHVQKNDDGTWNVRFDWFDSCQGEVTPKGLVETFYALGVEGLHGQVE